MSRISDPKLAACVADRRLSFEELGQPHSDAPSLRHFSVSQTAAILSLRETYAKTIGAEARPWDWSLYLVRAANLLSERAVGEASSTRGERNLLELRFLHPGFDFAPGPGRELGDPLVGALAEDRGLPLDAPPDFDLEAARWSAWCALLGRGLNALLSQQPLAVELHCALGVRRWERRAEQAKGEDPYAMRAGPPAAEHPRSSFIVRVWTEGGGLGSKLRAWLGGDTPDEDLLECWDARILSPAMRAGGLSRKRETPVEGPRALAPVRLGQPVQLGDEARMGLAPGQGGLRLVREGVSVMYLDAALAEAGLRKAPEGWIEAPKLRLTADEHDLVRDANFDALVAWLHDLQAHTHVSEQGEKVIWPEAIAHLSTVSGRPVAIDELRQWISVGRELLYVAPNRQEEVSAAMKARVLRVWPSELRAVEGALPGARWVPVRALGERPSLDPIDLTSLEQGSFAPQWLARGHELAVEGQRVYLSARAYLHRFSGANLGSILVLAYGRRVAHTRDHTRTVGGVTLVIELEARGHEALPTQESLRAAPAVLEGIFARGVELIEAAQRELLGVVIQSANPWDNPFFREHMGKLDAAALEFRYRETPEGLRLAWADHPAMQLEVARDDAGQALSLDALLRRVREVGFVVVRRGDQSFPRLESSRAELSALRVRRAAREFVGRLLGPEVALELPLVPEAQPRVGDANFNRGLLTRAELAEDDLARAGVDPRARLRARARLLVARALDQDALGAEGARIWWRWDPRAAEPRRAQSLRALAMERPSPGLIFPGAGSRELEGVALEVTPAIAALLAAHEGYLPARRSVGKARGSAGGGRTSSAAPRTPGRRHKAGTLPLLRARVDHPHAIGALSVAADGSSPGVALWSRGLKVGTVRLPEPLGRVGGRLWLTPQGRLVRSRELQGMAAELAAELLAKAPYERVLLPPEDPRHAALSALVAYVQGVIGKTSGALSQSAAFAKLRAALELEVEARESFEAQVDASLRRWPMKPGPGQDRLAELLRYALAQKAPITRATFSWKVAELEDGRSTIELGNRNRWIKRAEDDARSRYEGAAMVLDAVFRDPAWRGEMRAEAPERWAKQRDWALRSHFRLLARWLEVGD